MAKSKKRRKTRRRVGDASNLVNEVRDIFNQKPMTLEERVELLENILEDGKADKLYGRPVKHGDHWTARDERNMVDHFVAQIPVTTIASMLQRTPFAIFCRLMRHYNPVTGQRLLTEKNVYKVMAEIVRDDH